MIIYKAKTKEINELLVLETQCFKTDLFSRQQLYYFLRANSALMLNVRKNKKLVGSALLLCRKHSFKARLYSIAVHPDYQGKKIALRLYKTLESFALKKKRKEIYLEVRKDNKRAISFYRKQGFVKFGEHHAFYEDKMDALRMKKILD